MSCANRRRRGPIASSFIGLTLPYDALIHDGRHPPLGDYYSRAPFRRSLRHRFIEPVIPSPCRDVQIAPVSLAIAHHPARAFAGYYTAAITEPPWRDFRPYADLLLNARVHRRFHHSTHRCNSPEERAGPYPTRLRHSFGTYSARPRCQASTSHQ